MDKGDDETNSQTPMYTPTYSSFCHRDPLKGTPNCGKHSGIPEVEVESSWTWLEDSQESFFHPSAPWIAVKEFRLLTIIWVWVK